MILQYFDPECYIRIETDVSGYAIDGVFSQMITETGQWHPVAYYSQKIVLAKMRYETHDAKLLAIVDAFKNWRHYPEGCQYKVLVLTNHNNPRQFMDMKSLSFRQVHWTQELFRYYFHIDYYQDKANRAPDALFYYLQQSQSEEKSLQAGNMRIF